MDPILSYVSSKQEEIIAFIREMVECESPSGDAAAMGRFVDLFASRTSDIARMKTLPAGLREALPLRVQIAGPEEDRADSRAGTRRHGVAGRDFENDAVSAGGRDGSGDPECST
jgi:hypothetical protein